MKINGRLGLTDLTDDAFSRSIRSVIKDNAGPAIEDNVAPIIDDNKQEENDKYISLICITRILNRTN